MAATLRDLHFSSTQADPDVWIRSAGTHYDMILVYVDDVLVFSKDPRTIMNQLGELYELKPESLRCRRKLRNNGWEGLSRLYGSNGFFFGRIEIRTYMAGMHNSSARVYDRKSCASCTKSMLSNSLWIQVEDHATQPLQMTRNCLRTNAPKFKANVQKVRRLALEGMRSIRTYFGPACQVHQMHRNTSYSIFFMVAAIQSRVVVTRASRVTQSLVTAATR